MTPRLELRGIRKRYPGVVANDGISARVMPGEIHAVLGENGAGKSTLMKIIYGAVLADEGEILCDGEPIRAHNPAVSRALGIEMVYQHFALFESVTVVENIALSVGGRFDLAALSRRISDVSGRYGLPIDPARLVHTLSVGERQRVEIVRCLLQDPRLLILDEPTSVLTPQAVPKLFETLRQLAGEGCSILYISHKLHEVQELCDTATVLRNGRVAGTVDPRAASTEDIARLMVGTELPETRVAPSELSPEPVLEVRELSAEPEDRFGTRIADVSFEVFGGEIVGIAGISGNGQAELADLLSGERTLAAAPGAIRMFGEPVAHLGAGRRRRLGFAFVPEERLGRGAVPPHHLGENAILTGHRTGMIRRGLVDRRRAREYAGNVISRFDVRTNGVGSPRPEPFRRQPPEIHRRARDRAAARHTPGLAADLGRRRRRGRLHTPDPHRHQPDGGGHPRDLRGARRAVRDLRPDPGHVRGRAVALAPARGDDLRGGRASHDPRPGLTASDGHPSGLAGHRAARGALGGDADRGAGDGDRAHGAVRFGAVRRPRP